MGSLGFKLVYTKHTIYIDVNGIQSLLIEKLVGNYLFFLSRTWEALAEANILVKSNRATSGCS